MIDAGSRSEQYGQVQFFGEIKGLQGHLFGLLRCGRLQHGHPGKLGIKTVVLFVLTGKQGGVIGGQDDHARIDPGIGQGH